MGVAPEHGAISTIAMVVVVSRPVAKICPSGLASQTIYEILVVAIGGSPLVQESHEMGRAGQVDGRRPDACVAVA